MNLRPGGPNGAWIARGLLAAGGLVVLLAAGIAWLDAESPPPAASDSAEPAEPAPIAGDDGASASAPLAADAPTEDWLGLTTLDTPEPTRRAAIAVVAARPDLAPALVDRIGSEDPETARHAMYLVGDLDPPPAAAGEAVKARLADVLAIARAIDPAAPDSREQLYAQAHLLADGVLAAAGGLRRAGIDLRPELRLMAAATRDREKEPPRLIADAAERIAAGFDRQDREGPPVPAIVPP